jgi:hypothetical protein
MLFLDCGQKEPDLTLFAPIPKEEPVQAEAEDRCE